jgi:glycosyltransferase involved in cell wall biosynthesis
LAASGEVRLTALYELIRHSSRSWETPQIEHTYRVLEGMRVEELAHLFDDVDLVIFSGYQRPDLRRAIRARAMSGRPWCFWGERPGFYLPRWIGQYYRALMLPDLHRQDIPIWGIGSWAVAAYRQEFGPTRYVTNVPYFSRLSPFLAIDRQAAVEAPRRILFSGSLIKRKGVDLLMRAFLDVAEQHSDLELHLIGDGPQREPLQRMAAGRVDRVHFHGFRQWNELSHFYAEADILCAPSRYDGWGMIIPEGLAAGLLVISTDQTGAARDLIGPDVGWVIKPNRIEPLVAALSAAASTAGAERTERIARGRAQAVAQDVTAGVPRVLKAIDATLAAFSATAASSASGAEADARSDAS